MPSTKDTKPKKQLMVRIDESLYWRLKREVVKRKTTLVDFVTEAIRSKLSEKP